LCFWFVGLIQFSNPVSSSLIFIREAAENFGRTDIAGSPTCFNT
jgi:hypothetical protein